MCDMLSISDFAVSIEKRMKRGKLTLDSCILFILNGLHDGEYRMSNNLRYLKENTMLELKKNA